MNKEQCYVHLNYGKLWNPSIAESDGIQVSLRLSFPVKETILENIDEAVMLYYCHPSYLNKCVMNPGFATTLSLNTHILLQKVNTTKVKTFSLSFSSTNSENTW